ncbi:MAG TPA: BadF/BadG/BcrA/BcrD ATPase family protein, partial [Blastocatellia bacterium]|nr:BadF/BadG/BcrA/BcrD ATPase family protein [Blastocatellia bacterium]
SNHTRAPGGRERLETAVTKSVSEAMQRAGLIERGLSIEEKKKAVRNFKFVSAHLAMTGEPEDKIEIVRTLLRAKRLKVGHDAPGALAGALPDADFAGAKIIVLAGTGSVAYGEKGKRQARIGGRGYLFSDDGSAFAMSREALRLALRGEDRGRVPEGLSSALSAYFNRDSLRTIAEDFYAGVISRERFAGFAAQLDRLAASDETAFGIIEQAAAELAEMAEAAALRLNAASQSVQISYGGGVFSSRRLLRLFATTMKALLPQAEIRAPRFGPDTGALLLAFRQAGIKITETILNHAAGKN